MKNVLQSIERKEQHAPPFPLKAPYYCCESMHVLLLMILETSDIGSDNNMELGVCVLPFHQICH